MMTSFAPPIPPIEPEKDQTVPEENGGTVTARYPNHVWHIDLTVVPTRAGFWVSWFPFTLLQVWPFAYWVAIIVDHFSRKVMGFAVFNKQPSSLEFRSFLARAISRNRTKPKYVVSDRGCQFDCKAFREWAKRRSIKLKYGAVGKYSSIAVIERFILSLKSEFTNRLLIPLNMNEFREELGSYMTWYKECRPHQSRDGRSPEEVHSNAQPQAPPSESIPNSRLPDMQLAVSHLHGNKLLPLVHLKKAA